MRVDKENFEVIKKLGEGAFAETFLVKVVNPKLVKDWGFDKVVIKVPKDKQKEKVLLKEILNNVTLRATLDGIKEENVVKAINAVELYRDRYVMVMEYSPGQDLRSRMGAIGNGYIMNPDEALEIAKQICNGLIAIHKSKIFHRDIKPENILVCDNGVIKIMDLGISKIISSVERASTTAGTLYYMPPEILQEGNGGSFYSDIYSLGVTMYEMITGRLPFIGGGIGEIVHKIETGRVASPKDVNTRIDAVLSDIIMKAMHVDPDQRFKSADELLTAIELYEKGENPESILGNDEILEARKLLHAEKLNEAKTRFESLVKKYPQNPHVFLYLGEIHSRCYSNEKAISVYRKGLSLHPEFGLLYRNLAICYSSQKEYSKAIESMKKAISKELNAKENSSAKKMIGIWENLRENEK